MVSGSISSPTEPRSLQCCLRRRTLDRLAGRVHSHFEPVTSLPRLLSGTLANSCPERGRAADDTHRPFSLFAGSGLGSEAFRFRCLETSDILSA